MLLSSMLLGENACTCEIEEGVHNQATKDFKFYHLRTKQCLLSFATPSLLKTGFEVGMVAVVSGTKSERCRVREQLGPSRIVPREKSSLCLLQSELDADPPANPTGKLRECTVVILRMLTLRAT